MKLDLIVRQKPVHLDPYRRNLGAFGRAGQETRVNALEMAVDRIGRWQIGDLLYHGVAI